MIDLKIVLIVFSFLLFGCNGEKKEDVLEFYKNGTPKVVRPRCPPERYWRFATSDPYMIAIESTMR